MNDNWSACKKILCIRPDNMGDLIMSSPAIRALKNSFHCHITVLTSGVAGSIASYIPEIDEVITFDLPWVKNNAVFDNNAFADFIENIRGRGFDGAVIFTVYSQNPLPSAMIAFMAGIPRRLAYCRENPYALLTDWIPEKEPYRFIRHQVQRDLDLVGNIGAITDKVNLSLHVDERKLAGLQQKMERLGLDNTKSWVILHAGVSETKREFPEKNWISIGKQIIKELNHQVVYTGTVGERELITRLTEGTGAGAISLAGSLSLEEFILLIKKSPLVISVNTGTIHIAAAVGTPIIVLYALTNPQHAPWKATGKIFPFAIPIHLQSRNEVIRYVSENMEENKVTDINMHEVLQAAGDILAAGSSFGNGNYLIPELVNMPVINEVL